MKVYSYKMGYFLISVLGPNILMIAVLIWGINDRLQGNSSLLNQFIIMVIPFLLINALGASNHPYRVTDDGEKLIFHGFLLKHSYFWSDITFLRIRRFLMTDRILIRIGKQGLLRGRYWIDVDSLLGSDELIDKMIPYDRNYEQNNKGKTKRKK